MTKLASSKSIFLSIIYLSLIAPCGAKAVTSIKTCDDLYNIQKNLNDQYVLENDIDCSNYGLMPIGTLNAPFTGSLDGKNHIIKHINFYLTKMNYVGLFGVTDGATISNLHLDYPSVIGQSFVGALIGMGKRTTINSVRIDQVDSVAPTDTRVIAGISGKNADGTPHESLGGLAGALFDSTVNNSYVFMNVYAYGDPSVIDKGLEIYYYYVGGLIGKSENTTINASHTFGQGISGSFAVGGLVGKMLNGTIKQSYSSSHINPKYYTPRYSYNLGGLVGEMDVTAGGKSLVTDSYSSAYVSDGLAENTGGLIGYINSASKSCTDTNVIVRVENSYADRAVSGEANIGGLIGKTVGSVTLQNTYSAGPLSGTIGGGMIGYITPGATGSPVCTTSSYWNKDTEILGGRSGSTGVGKTTSEMQHKSTYIDWDFTTIWGLMANEYPCLRGVAYCK